MASIVLAGSAPAHRVSFQSYGLNIHHGMVALAPRIQHNKPWLIS
jgi:hypothetical protein